jgi:hypothetical protein
VKRQPQPRPDSEAVLRGLKDFQRRTVDHVFDRLYTAPDPTYRFLVADEVGLGKTLVARGVIARAVDHLRDEVGRVDIVYICSNADIARQNLDRLNIASEDDAALSSRLTMLASQIRGFRQKKLNLVSFTPGTSFDHKGGTGRFEERVLLYWLIRTPWRLGHSVAPMNVLQDRAGTEKFRRAIRSFNTRGIDPTIRRAFLKRLAAHEAEQRERGERTLRSRFHALCKQLPRARRSRIPDEIRWERSDVVGDLRAILAAGCVTALEPDIVILDEFQRFRHLLDPQDEASKLAHELFNYGRARETGEIEERCRTLLLSATPYKMYTMAGEAGDEDHYRDFLDTAGFLFGAERPKRELEELLAALRREMLRVASANRERVLELRERIEELLRRVMVRTERLAVTSDRNGMLRTVTEPRPTLERRDVAGYVELQRVARELDHHDVIEYWKSAPYCLNFMDEYKLKRDFVASAGDGALRSATESGDALLDWPAIERYRRLNPGNARMRCLSEAMVDSEAWRLLWIPPSLPYYTLDGPFADPALRNLTKRLVFSAWNVVPKTIAGVISYQAEREMMRSRGGRPLNTPEARAKRTRSLEFSRRRRRGAWEMAGMPVLALIYPSSVLAAEIDPLQIGREHFKATGELPTRTAALNEARLRCRKLLAPVTKAIVRDPTKGEDEAWYWAAPFLLDRTSDPDTVASWFANPSLVSGWSGASGEREASGFADHIDRARELIAGDLRLGDPPNDLDRVVAGLALGGPAVCALRALGRVIPEAPESGDARLAAGSIAFAFRRLFNAPDVSAMVRGRQKLPYWRRMLDYSIDGGLQPMLDEYAHVLVEALGLIDKPADVRVERIAKEMRRSIGLGPGRVRMHDIDLSREDGEAIVPHEMRARYARRFGTEEDEPVDGTERTRADQLRSAFNSPFWPFVLATTSIGQEGLDFHLYCHSVVHWNLPSNPVDLEQREGRIHRFKGHAVRKNLASTHCRAGLGDDVSDPWESMFDEAAMARPAGATDLVPYWVYAPNGGAAIERHIPALPLSRDATRFGRLMKSLAVYRMVFGQPRQDDLVELLLSQLPSEEQEQRQGLLEMLRIDLAPP